MRSAQCCCRTEILVGRSMAGRFAAEELCHCGVLFLREGEDGLFRLIPQAGFSSMDDW